MDGWQVAWGKAVTVSNSTAEAFAGTHSLKIAIAAGETHAAVDNETASQLTAFVPGVTVTLHVFNSGVSGIVVYPFAYNEVWIPSFGAGVALGAGWNAVSYVVPASFHSVNGVGVQIDSLGGGTGALYLDAVGAGAR